MTLRPHCIRLYRAAALCAGMTVWELFCSGYCPLGKPARLVPGAEPATAASPDDESRRAAPCGLHGAAQPPNYLAFTWTGALLSVNPQAVTIAGERGAAP